MAEKRFCFFVCLLLNWLNDTFSVLVWNKAIYNCALMCMFEVKFWSIVLLVAFAFTLRAKRCSFLLEFSVSCWQLNFFVITHFYQIFPNEFPFVARVFFYSYLYFEKIRNNIQLIRTIYPNNYARISVLCEIVFLKTNTEFLKNWNVRSKILARRRKIDFCF